MWYFLTILPVRVVLVPVRQFPVASRGCVQAHALVFVTGASKGFGRALAVEAAELMEQKRITSVLVVDENNILCGVVNSNDLMRAKVI